MTNNPPILYTLRFGGVNTVTGLRPPSDPSDAVRKTDVEEATQLISLEIQSGLEQESIERTGELSALESSLQAQLQQLESLLSSADNAILSQLQSQISTATNGFIPQVVYAVFVEPITLSGLSKNTSSFGGNLPPGEKVLVIGQGGGIGIPSPDNRIYITDNGQWLPIPEMVDGAELRQRYLVSVLNGSLGYENSLFALTDPSDLSSAIAGVTNLIWNRWLRADSVAGDGLTTQRTGDTLGVLFNPGQMQTGGQGLELSVDFINTLRSLEEATGSLDVSKISGLLNFLRSTPISDFSSPVSDLDFAEQRITNLANPVESGDAVNLGTVNQLLSSFSPPDRGKVFDLMSFEVIDGDTHFLVEHNFDTINVLEKVLDTTDGSTVSTDFIRVINQPNFARVIFRNANSIEPGRFRLLLIKCG